METPISSFVKERRKIFNLTQMDLAEKTGVGLRFVLDLKERRPSLRLEEENQVKHLFGHEVEAMQRVNQR